MAWQGRRRGQKNREDESWVGKSVKIKSFSELEKKGFAFVDGELWACVCEESLSPGELAVIERVDGLKLFLKKKI